MNFEIGDKITLTDGRSGTICIIGSTVYGPGIWLGIITDGKPIDKNALNFQGIFVNESDVLNNNSNALIEQNLDPLVESLILDKCLLEEEIELLKERLDEAEELNLEKLTTANINIYDQTKLIKALVKYILFTKITHLKFG